MMQLNELKKIIKNIYGEGKDKTNEYLVLDGKYGSYIKVQSLKKSTKSKLNNAKLPDDIDPKTLTLEKVCEIIKNSYSNRFKKKGDKEDKEEKVKNIADKKVKKDSKETKEKPKPKPTKKISKDEKDEMDDIFGIDVKKKKVAKPKVAKEPKHKVAKESKPKVAKEPKPKVAKEPKPKVAKEPKPKVAKSK